MQSAQIYQRSIDFLGKQAPVSRQNYKKPLLIALLAGIAAWVVGAWLEIITGYFYFFLVLYLLRVAYWVKVMGDSPESADRVARGGIYTVAVVYGVLALYIALRIPNLPLWASFLVFIVSCAVGWLVIWPLISEGEKTKQRMIYFGVLGRPALFSWILVSVVYTLSGLLFSRAPDLQLLKKVTQGRKELKEKVAPNVTVAVALSGGGYRAATIHTGVLRVLDREKIPIDYLSTVSGGSIIGGYYALGHTADEFESVLKRKPGLPNDLFHIGYFFLELVWPWWADSDTYAKHFARTYFGDARLRNVERPILLVNATNYTTRHREVFPSGPDGKWADENISDVVAASGAFPGAFEPKKIGKDYYIDGGVVENLGVEGLTEYLRTDESHLEPDILIISNASKEARTPRVHAKMFRFTLLSQASSDSYEALHDQIFRLYTENTYDPDTSDPRKPLKQPYKQSRARIFGKSSSGNGKTAEKVVYVFILNGTSDAEQQYMKAAGKNQADGESKGGGTPIITESTPVDVAKFSTLKELEQTEVKKGVWVGETIAGKYVKCIQHYIKEIQAGKDPGEKCPPDPINTRP